MIVTRPITTNYGNYDRKASVQQGSGALKLGQIVHAVALTNSNRGHVSLRVGETVINASTNITFQQNAHLSLEVVQIQPHLLLKLIPSPAGSAATRALQDAMISWLPQQSGIAPALAQLIHKIMMDGKSLEQQSTRALVDALINGLPTRNTLIHAEGVRQAIIQSGLFLESILSRSVARYRTDIKKDIKACLLRILHIIGQDRMDNSSDTRIQNSSIASLLNTDIPPRRKGLPVTQSRVPFSSIADIGDMSDDGPDLYCKIQGAIARLGLLQVNTAENFFSGEYFWQLEIPVKHTEAIETVSISIENEQKDPLHEERNTWIVNLALDLPQLGQIEIRISLYRQGVSSCFWSDSPDTLSLIQSQFEQLKSKLKHHKIETLALCCQQGQPKPTEPLDAEVSNMDFQV